ncbi:histone-lysine N-methyltransferase ASHH2 [Mercurialis annua]|uniref:histone-lysine N-methyltransferase ASHH2 n=1 Tax=Mercurialis annua TaxID=3986 RepID=UPI00215E38B0|nr:histone-lysine N-methyltransferase ASHH2 [Mercurialis annua]
MGSCENSLEVEVVNEPLDQTAVMQQQQKKNMCLVKVLVSEQDQLLPSLEDGFDISNGNVGPTNVLDCGEISGSVKAGGCVSSSDLMEGVSVVDHRISAMCDNGNAVRLVPGKLAEDECGFTGGNLNERQSGIDDCSVGTDGLYSEKVGCFGENHGPEKLLENSKQSLLEGTSVDKGNELVSEHGNKVNLVSAKLSENESEIIDCDLNERRSGADDCTCAAKIDEFCADKVKPFDENNGLMNSLEDCDQALESIPFPGLLENYDERDQQRDVRTDTVQGDFEEGCDSDAATRTDICDQVRDSLLLEVSAKLWPINTSPRNELEEEKQQGSSTSLQRDIVTENKSVIVTGIDIDDHNQVESSVDHDSMPQLMPTTESLNNCLQQDDQTVNTYSAAEQVINNVSPLMKATICNQLVSHQCFNKSMELMPLIGSPEKSVQQDEQKFDRPNSYSDGATKSDGENLATKKIIVDDKKLSSLVDKMCTESDSCSGFPGNCCQHNDLKTNLESVPLSRDVNQTSHSLATLDSDACIQKSPKGNEMPEELSVTIILASSCDRHNDQKSGKSVKCFPAESVSMDVLRKSHLDGCTEACPSQACQQTLENSAMADSLDNSDQKNERRDEYSVTGPFAESKPDVIREGSNVTTEIKVEICGHELLKEGLAHAKECSPKISLNSPQSCHSFGATRSSSCRQQDVAHLDNGFFSAVGPADFSEQSNSGGKYPTMNDSPSKTTSTDIGSSSSRRSSQTHKSSQKPQKKRTASKCRKKNNVQELQVFKAERRKRSCFSKPARSSNWGLLGSITQFFEQHNREELNEIQIDEVSQIKACQGGETGNKIQAGGRLQRSSVKGHASTSVIRLKVKLGNEVVQNSQNYIVPEVIDSSASADGGVGDFQTKSYRGASLEVPNFGNCVEVEMRKKGTEEQLDCFVNKLDEARLHSDALGSDVRVAYKEDSGGVVMSHKSSEDAEADYHGLPSHVEVQAMDVITEKGYADPGTSPDSEVINSAPEGQVNTRCQEDLPDAVLTSSKAFVTPRVVLTSKQGKKKGRVSHGRKLVPEHRSPLVARSNKAKASKNRVGKQRKGDELCSSEILFPSTSVNASSNSLSSKEFSEEQLPLSRETEVTVSGEVLPEEHCTVNKSSSGMDIGLRLLEPQNSSDLIPSTKSKGCRLPRKSGGSTKGESKVSDKERSKREDVCRQRRKDKKSKKKEVKGKAECNDLTNKEVHPEKDGTEKSDYHDIPASADVANLDTASSGAVEQHLPMDNAWVRCDACLKWRRIPVALVDSIGQTNCQWVCKDNTDNAFADCSIPQEKSNAEINAELGISDGEEDVCDAPSKNKGLEHKAVEYMHTTVSKEHEFSRISTNQFRHRSRKTQTIDEIMVCHCKLPLSGLGCGDECLNRMLNIECVRGTCPCGDLCSNQQFQKRNYAKMKWDRCGKKGFGLRLENDISSGQFLIEYVGEVLDMHTYEARQREYAYNGHKHFYFMTLNGSEVIDASAKGNLGRFINHSCDPNCRTEKWVVNGEICIGLFALRDIKKGEEVTFDYNYVRVFGAAAKKCYCNSPQCRGYIGGDPTSAEVIEQVDSDEEFLEPVMLEFGAQGNRSKNKISRTSSVDDVKLQATETILNDRDKLNNSIAAAGKIKAAAEIEYPMISSSAAEIEDPMIPSSAAEIEDLMIPSDPMIPSSAAIIQSPKSLEKGDLKESSPPSSQKADDAAAEFLPAVNQETSMEEIQRLETSSATMLSKSLSDAMGANKKPKSEEKRVFVKSRFLIKTSRDFVVAKKGKFASSFNSNKIQAMENKAQMLAFKSKKLMEGITNGRFEAVEGKLNELLDSDGGISKRKDSAKGYLKFLLLTAASGASGNGEAIQSNRDLSMILDALLKTKSRMVLIDVINKNGLRMLHNMLKQYRSDFKKTPILRKLLKVIEYLEAREILTQEHIYGGPPCAGMESFRKSMLSLTEHNDRQVHQIARSFRDRWFPRYGRKYSNMEWDDGRMELHRGSMSNRISDSQNHMRDLDGRSTEAIDGLMQLKPATASIDTTAHEGCSLPCVGDGTKTRKRKSRWDQEKKPSPRSHQHDEQRIQSGHIPTPDISKEVSDHIEKGSTENNACPHCMRNYFRQVEANRTDSGSQNSQSPVPPGFSSPLSPALVSLNASSSVADHPQQKGCLMFPAGVVVGQPQRKFLSRLSVSYGIPLSIVQQFGLPEGGSMESWGIAPGMAFHPFPPLPPFPQHKNEMSSAPAVNSMEIDATTVEGQQCRQDPASCSPSERSPSTSDANKPNVEVPGANTQQTLKRARPESEDLGMRYFRQQKWNKGPPWLPQSNGLESVTTESTNSYCPQDVSYKEEKTGECINQLNRT